MSRALLSCGAKVPGIEQLNVGQLNVGSFNHSMPGTFPPPTGPTDIKARKKKTLVFSTLSGLVWALQPPPQEDPSFEIPSFPDSAVSWLNANAGFGNHNLKGSYQFHADGVVEVDGLPTRGERASDFVINLNVSSDPAEQGVSLELGDEVRVTLPDGFVFDEDALEEFPICSLGKPCPSTLIADACLPGTLACSTVVFLQGYPQSAIPPDVSRDGNTLVLTPRAAIGPVVKNIHIIGKAIVNPGPGKYSVPVRHTDSGGNVLWKGSGKVRILPRIRRSINITSVFASLVGGGPPFANTIYQTVVSGETEFPWNFLLWDHKGEPYSDIELLQETENHYLLLRDGDTIGHARIDAPEGATGFSINNTLDVTLPGTPVIGLGPGGVPPPPVQRYEVQFDAGFAPVPGRYTTTLRLNNGNQVEMFVDVVE